MARRLVRGVADGVRNGAWCVGCCWALMASLFALGVISAVWMAVVAGLIALEKLLPLSGAVRRRLRHHERRSAYLIAAFNLFYALEQVILDYATWKPVIFINLGADGRRPGGAVPASFQRRRRRTDHWPCPENIGLSRAHPHPGHRVRPAHPAFSPPSPAVFRRPRPRAVAADPGPHRRRPGAAPLGLGLVHAGAGRCCTRGPTSWTTSTSRPW